MKIHTAKSCPNSSRHPAKYQPNLYNNPSLSVLTMKQVKTQLGPQTLRKGEPKKKASQPCEQSFPQLFSRYYRIVPGKKEPSF